MKTILITGAAGFLGSHLIDKLIPTNKIIAVDNLSSGRMSNILGGDWEKNRKIEVFFDDIQNFNTDSKIDEIYHLACQASPPYYQADPIKTLKTCFNGSMRVLEIAQKNSCKVLLASTSEVYGNPQVHPQREDYLGNVDTQGPRACYDEGKRVSETLFDAFSYVHGVETRIARIFNTFGPRMAKEDGRLVTNLIKNALLGKPMPIYGDGSQTRTLSWYENTINGLVSLMASEDTTNYPINIGGELELTVFEIAEIVGELIGTNKIEFCPLPHNDPVKRKPDLSRAKEILNYQSSFDLKSCFKIMIEDVKSQLAASSLN